jgi:hypothetical protein
MTPVRGTQPGERQPPAVRGSNLRDAAMTPVRGTQLGERP